MVCYKSSQIQTGTELLNGHIPTPASPIPAEIMQKYDIGKIIGDGNFSVVHECTNKYVIFYNSFSILMWL